MASCRQSDSHALSVTALKALLKLGKGAGPKPVCAPDHLLGCCFRFVRMLGVLCVLWQLGNASCGATGQEQLCRAGSTIVRATTWYRGSHPHVLDATPYRLTSKAMWCIQKANACIRNVAWLCHTGYSEAPKLSMESVLLSWAGAIVASTFQHGNSLFANAQGRVFQSGARRFRARWRPLRARRAKSAGRCCWLGFKSCPCRRQGSVDKWDQSCAKLYRVDSTFQRACLQEE